MTMPHPVFLVTLVETTIILILYALACWEINLLSNLLLGVDAISFFPCKLFKNDLWISRIIGVTLET
jgi:hypothetical protein